MRVLSDGRIRRTAPEWKEIIDRFGKSGLPIAEFCEKEEISRSAFASWKKKLGAAKKKALSFVEITSAARRKSSDSMVASSQTSFELALPGGVTLRWRG
ncbi:MAG: hypothetical protein JRF55_12395 [Deltaproteobacteria bacterium]|nr:hypothetical protein [Deltaproteobacteria bacterium]